MGYRLITTTDCIPRKESSLLEQILAQHQELIVFCGLKEFAALLILVMGEGRQRWSEESSKTSAQSR